MEEVIQKSMVSPPFSLLEIDLKEYEQLSQYPRGSEILSQLLNQFEDICNKVLLRDSDRIILQTTFSRLIIILAGTTKVRAMNVRSKLEQAFSQSPVLYEGFPVPFSVILGPVGFPEDGKTLKELLEKAKN